ncbi:nucleotidyltransferase [Staphylococcus simiae]|uniref:nucleotidyltransferase n=1 Tax=Staphylococcus simiae TaxID=308354 RepID=UPI001A969D86|nr:nucleotidyltransferase [Staphylococcus simiae]MBO1198605.1 nucleotidyltransferase [Staphylococcus simiae]MBO1200783.1 nucleotidyltransferase [Staphylococcus simiae]MBO1202991.1 nucleotidyltransferase [Staphylococcus simiae]MBO1210658.1 nucleotidyltransferase [Staphylococcus simiae]MBO1229119.1 nucleotidyltransferase [Staphylococcus simiae]
MKSVGLITEYNPFHNGHQHHIIQSKKISQADVTVAIMSGNFVMRGEPAIYNKFTRATMALSSVDLVVELPLIASLSSSDYFAQLAVKVADYLDIDCIVFGSESGNIELLKKLSQQLSMIEQSDEFNTKLKQGKSYPRIISELLNHHQALQSPNNMLGLSYLKAINQLAPHIEAQTVSRQQSSHHDTNIHHNHFASGTSIRKSLFNNNDEWKNVVPTTIQKLYQQPHMHINHVFEYLQYQIEASEQSDLTPIYTMSEGFENRLKSKIKDATNLKHFVELLKTKRYTYTHIQRLLMNVLLNIKQQDVSTHINGVRILAMNEQGRAYLKLLKSKFPERVFATNINKSNRHLFKNEIKSTTIYNLISGQTQHDFNTPVIQKF